MLEKTYDLEEISKDFDTITELLNKHNRVIAQARGIYMLNRNGAIMDDEDERKYKIYSHYESEANNALFYMKETLQPALQKYIDLYINNFSKRADEDIDNLLAED